MRGTTTDPDGGSERRAERPRLVLLRGGLGTVRPAWAPAVPDEDGDPGVAVAAEVAAALAGVTDDVASSAPLTLPLALSVCMERHAVGTSGLIDVMQALRASLLAVADLDADEEPVPLVAGDARLAALRLAEHLRRLLARAAQTSAAAPDVLASAAAARLA